MIRVFCRSFFFIVTLLGWRWKAPSSRKKKPQQRSQKDEDEPSTAEYEELPGLRDRSCSNQETQGQGDGPEQQEKPSCSAQEAPCLRKGAYPRRASAARGLADTVRSVGAHLLRSAKSQREGDDTLGWETKRDALLIGGRYLLICSGCTADTAHFEMKISFLTLQAHR